MFRRGMETPAPRGGLSAGRDGQDLAAFIVTASRTDPVRHVGRRALGTGTQLGQPKRAVVGAAHALAALGRFAFRDTHKSIVLKLQFV